MIRINLLETSEKKRRRKREIPSGAPIIGLYVLLLLLEGFLLYYWSTLKEDQLRVQQGQLLEAQKKLEGFQKLTAERDELAGKMDEEKQQAEIFEQLNAATVGPANLLMYLAYSLTTPPLENHAERVVQEQVGWNTQWDPDRAWFTSIREDSKQELTLVGMAISHHDTDEVLRRVKDCIYFQAVQFKNAKVQSNKTTGGQSLVEFRLTAAVNYDLNVGKESAKAGGKDDAKKKKKEKLKKRKG